MGTLAAHRQAAALDVSHRVTEHAVVGAVVDGQLHLKLVDVDMAHHAVAGGVQGDVIVLRQLRVLVTRNRPVPITASAPSVMNSLVPMPRSWAERYSCRRPGRG